MTQFLYVLGNSNSTNLRNNEYVFYEQTMTFKSIYTRSYFQSWDKTKYLKTEYLESAQSTTWNSIIIYKAKKIPMFLLTLPILIFSVYSKRFLLPCRTSTGKVTSLSCITWVKKLKKKFCLPTPLIFFQKC